MKVKDIFNGLAKIMEKINRKKQMEEFREEISLGMKELEKWCGRAIIRDREWLEMIEPVIQKASPRNRTDKKIIKPLVKLKKVLLNQIKLFENFLARK